MGFFKNIIGLFKSKKDDYYYKYYYYNRLAHSYDSLSPYYHLYKKAQSLPSIESKSKISILNKFSFESTYADVLNIMDKPRYRVDNTGLLKTQILFYKTHIGKYRVKCELHFFNKEIFACKYVFTRLKQEDKKQLISILHSKYDVSEEINLTKNTIIDPEGHIIIVTDNFDLVFSYLNPKNLFFDEIRLIAKQEKQLNRRRKQRKITELYKKL